MDQTNKQHQPNCNLVTKKNLDCLVDHNGGICDWHQCTCTPEEGKIIIGCKNCKGGTSVCNCSCHKIDRQESWEKELWSLLYDEYGDVGQNGNIKFFIKSLLASQAKEIEDRMIKMIDGMIKEETERAKRGNCTFANQALEEIKNRFRELK